MCGRCPHWAGGRCRHVGPRCFSILIAVGRGILSWMLERGGRYVQVVAKTGFTITAKN